MGPRSRDASVVKTDALIESATSPVDVDLKMDLPRRQERFLETQRSFMMAKLLKNS